MKMLLVCVGFMLCAVLSAATGIREGMSLLEVETQLGRPISTLNKGGATILLYPNQGRVELVDGKVVRMSRVPYFDDATVMAPTPAEGASGSGEIESKKATPPVQDPVPASFPATAPEPDSEWKLNTQAQRNLEAAVERMANSEKSSAPGSLTGEAELVAKSVRFWIKLFVALVVQIGVGVIVLKLAFVWTEVHADWGQMVLPACAAAVSGALVRGVAYATWQTDQLFYLDDAVSYGALFFALMKTTHACTWKRAAGVAAASKLMAMTIWAFLNLTITVALVA